MKLYRTAHGIFGEELETTGEGGAVDSRQNGVPDFEQVLPASVAEHAEKRHRKRRRPLAASPVYAATRRYQGAREIRVILYAKDDSFCATAVDFS